MFELTPEERARADYDAAEERALRALDDIQFEAHTMSKSKVAEVLDMIDGVLVNNDIEGLDLWSILTALRGPDDDNADAKKRYTNPVRSAAFPRAARAARAAYGPYIHAGPYIHGASYATPGTPLSFDSQLLTHFAQHIKGAVHALKRVRTELLTLPEG